VSVPNISEGRDPRSLGALAQAAASGGAHLLDLHADADHNRAVLSLVSGYEDRLLDSLLALVAAAVTLIDLTRHSGVHPRSGAADVVPFVALEDAAMGDCVQLARRMGARAWKELGLPVYFYGQASNREGGTTLAEIRAGRVPVDLGSNLHPTAGALCVGARPPLLAYNVLLEGATLAQAAAMARLLRESAGGMSGVQALAFELSGGRTQISMNLTRLEVNGPLEVLAEVTRLADEAGFAVRGEEVVGLCPARVATSPAADGRLLEARISAAAARSGAASCRGRGGHEQELLAGSFERMARDLANLGADQREILDAAEATLALRRVLAAAGCTDEEIEAMLVVAADGFVRALRDETRIRYPERVRLLQ
jgi:glutamate formiminotransferase